MHKGLYRGQNHRQQQHNKLLAVGWASARVYNNAYEPQALLRIYMPPVFVLKMLLSAAASVHADYVRLQLESSGLHAMVGTSVSIR